MIRRLLALPLLLVLAAPAHGQRARVAARDRDRISPEEVRGSTASDAYQLVQSLRSMWLARHEDRLRAPSRPPVKRDAEGLIGTGVNDRQPEEQHPDDVNSADGLIVLLDATFLGGKDALREVPVNRIASLEYLSPEKAAIRFSRRARDGAIVIHTLTARDP